MTIKNSTRHNEINNLYKIKKVLKGIIMAKCKDWSIGAKNAPSWEKICWPIAQIAGCDITQSSINTNFVGVSKARKSRLV